MSLYITSLNSGSNGNCYYIGNDSEAVLIDAGISCKETEKRMKRLGLSMQLVKAIFISHEHSDHIRGLEVLARKYRLPVYITTDTMTNGGLTLEAGQVQSFRAGAEVRIGGLTVTAFTKQHDAIEPHSFVISGNDVTIGVFTDIGVSCEEVIRHFRQCHAVFLETNYDPDLLENGRYPYHLKNRIRGGKGHLSNIQALDLFILNRPPFMSHLLLSHLSQDNNRPELVRDLFEEYADGTMIIVASRHEESEVYQIIAGPPVRELPDRRQEDWALQVAAREQEQAKERQRLAALKEEQKETKLAAKQRAREEAKMAERQSGRSEQPERPGPSDRSGKSGRSGKWGKAAKSGKKEEKTFPVQISLFT